MRKHTTPIKAGDNTESLVVLVADSPHGGVTPAPYDLPPALERFESTFDADCKAILPKLDRYNGDYRDAEIQKIRDTARAQLEEARADHRKNLIYWIRKTWENDLIRCNQKLESNERERLEVDKELIRLEGLLNSIASNSHSRIPNTTVNPLSKR